MIDIFIRIYIYKSCDEADPQKIIMITVLIKLSFPEKNERPKI